MVRFLSPYSSSGMPGEGNKPVYPVRIFLITLAIFLIIAISYGVAKYWYNPYLEGQINDQKKAIEDLSRGLSEKDRADLTDFYSRINNIKTILANHIYISNFFNKLEELTDKSVEFSDISINSNQRIVKVSGLANRPSALINQLLAFEEEPLFKSLNLNQISLEKDGISFKFDGEINYDPALLLFNIQ